MSDSTVIVGNANSRQEGGKHYKEMGVEPWDVIDTWSVEQQIGYHRGNALKYIMRMGSKDEQLQEVRKAGHYITKLIEILEKRDADNDTTSSSGKSDSYSVSYSEQEALFCAKEYADFYRADSDEWRDTHRKAVLDKREEFRNLWNSKYPKSYVRRTSDSGEARCRQMN